MQYRKLGKTGYRISEISLGTWQVGGKWGSGFDHDNAEKILRTAIDKGVNFIDTADVYEDGLSETAVGKAVRESGENIYVATKCGRKINPHVSAGYTPAVLEGYVDDSLRRTGLETIDLIQLHCPPRAVYDRPEIFGAFETMRDKGKIRHLGVSVETVEEAMRAIVYDNVATVQIIFNIFRQKPAELFFPAALDNDVGVIVRVPLASGLLTGLYSRQTTFTEGDHRQFNREGAAFDKGETFSGVPYERGLKAVDKLKTLFPGMENLAPAALQWILTFDAVSCIIPGASRPGQVISNLSVYDLSPLTDKMREEIRNIYDRYVRAEVHHLW